MVNINISREQNKLVRGLIEEKCAAYKNWLASAVEQENTPYALKLVKELRTYEAMYHDFLPDDMVKEA